MESRRIKDADRYIERLEEGNEILRARISVMQEVLREADETIGLLRDEVDKMISRSTKEKP